MANQFPPELIAKINEFTGAGFILFRYDANMNPQVISNFDNNNFATAMQVHIRNWLEAVEQMNLDLTIQSIKNQSRRRKKS